MRTVEVRPPSATGETGFVLRALAAVLFGTLFVLGIRYGRINGGGAEQLFPFQRAFADLDSALQRDYRELREGFVEAARMRGGEGRRWPTVERLASEGIPPFAGDGVDGPVRQWQRIESGLLVLYVGTPDPSATRPQLLLQILEPEPGNAENRNPNTPIDEVHQRLPDGTLVHVSTWYRETSQPELRADPGFAPELAGWTQMVAGASVLGSGTTAAPGTAPRDGKERQR